MQKSASLVVCELAPRQVRRATMLVEGRRGRDVAVAIGVSPETISRWKGRPEFQELTGQLLQQGIDASRLGIISLCAESIDDCAGLIRSFSDATSWKTITFILSRVGP